MTKFPDARTALAANVLAYAMGEHTVHGTKVGTITVQDAS